MKLKKDKRGRIIVPKFPRITLDKLESFDILQHYYGNRLTQWQGQSGQKKKYKPTTMAPYHTNQVYDFGSNFNKTFLMDTEIRNTGSLLETEYMTKKKTRIDVIRRKDLTAEDVKILAEYLANAIGREHWYGITRFGSFAKRLKYVGWMFHFVNPGTGQVVCSGRVARGFELCKKPISPYKYNNTIPNDITVYAMEHRRLFDIFTLKEAGELL